MFEKGEAVFVRPQHHKHPLRKFSGCAGIVGSVLSAGLRSDKKKDIADSVTVIFENFDGAANDIRETFDETDLGYNRRSMELVVPDEWAKERRITFFDRIKALGKKSK